MFKNFNEATLFLLTEKQLLVLSLTPAVSLLCYVNLQAECWQLQFKVKS